MPAELLNILVQLPIVVAFIWYSDHKDKQFMEFLRQEREARERQGKEIVSELRNLRDDVRSAPAMKRREADGL